MRIGRRKKGKNEIEREDRNGNEKQKLNMKETEWNGADDENAKIKPWKTGKNKWK